MGNYWHILKCLVKREIRNHFYTKLILAGHVITPFFHLIIFYFTAKAFAPQFENIGGRGSDYFTYLVVGEAVMVIPLLLLSTFIENIKSTVSDGSFDILLIQKFPFEWTMVFMSVANIITAIPKIIITLIMAQLVFGLDVDFTGFFGVILLVLCAIPLFMGIGVLASSIIIIFGRGEGILDMFSSLVLISSGAFFPASVLPEYISQALHAWSPYNILVYESRSLLSLGISEINLNVYLKLLIPGLIIIPISFFVLKYALNYQRNRGAPLIFTQG